MDQRIFLPFHYGYWDEDHGHQRAANELTISGWDPVSKQPYYKYAAVQVRKAGGVLTGLGSKALDVASKAVDRAKEMADQVLSGTHPTPRSHVPDAIGQLRSGLSQLAEACRWLKKVHFEELESVGTCETLAQWCEECHKRLDRFAQQYGEQPAKEP